MLQAVFSFYQKNIRLGERFLSSRQWCNHQWEWIRGKDSRIGVLGVASVLALFLLGALVYARKPKQKSSFDSLKDLSSSPSSSSNSSQVSPENKNSLAAAQGSTQKSWVPKIYSPPAQTLFTYQYHHKFLQNDFDKLPKPPSVGSLEEKEMFATAQQHLEQNRYRNVLPNEASRFKHSNDSKFYYNANRVYFDHLLVGETPLSSTDSQQNFWEMILDSECSAIVLLSSPQKNCDDYLSFSNSGNTGSDITISVKSSEVIYDNRKQGESQRQILKKDIVITKGTNQQTISHYTLTNWPEHGVVPITDLRNLVKILYEHRKKYPKNSSSKFIKYRPLSIVGPTAIGPTGVVAGALSTYEFYQQRREGGFTYPNLKEQLFTVAEEIGSPKHGRVGIIETIDQYSCIYGTVGELLKEAEIKPESAKISLED